MPLSTKIYTVSDPVAFHALYLPLPENSQIFLCAAGRADAPHPPPGVRLVAGVHYLIVDGSFVLGSDIDLNVGDLIVLDTFS